MYWLCNEAASEVDSSLRFFNSAKIWIRVRARYESANPDAPNYKAFKATIGKIKTTIGYNPLNVKNMRDHKKPYREALRKLANEVLEHHANLIRNESGYVLTQILDCQLRIVKFNPIGSGYQPLPKHLASTKQLSMCVTLMRDVSDTPSFQRSRTPYQDIKRATLAITLRLISSNIILIRSNIRFLWKQSQILKTDLI